MADREHALESPHVAVWSVVAPAIGFILFVAASIVALALYYRAGLRDTTPQPKEFPAPRVQITSGKELAQSIKAARKRLGAFAWIDKDKHLIHIPIEDAMARIAAR